MRAPPRKPGDGLSPYKCRICGGRFPEPHWRYHVAIRFRHPLGEEKWYVHRDCHQRILKSKITESESQVG